MKSLIHRLYETKKIDCPAWLPDNLCYLTLMGSRAYGIENKDSDFDYYGACVTPRKNIFPQEYGLLLGFDDIPVFEQFKKDHFLDVDSGKDMEITIYGIVRYFNLLSAGNPNIIESLYTNREHVVFSNIVGEKIRDNRHLFLSKQSFIKTRQYAFAQLKKLDRIPVGKRLENYNIHGYDTKFAAHTIRLMDNCEQIITNKHIDLQRNKEMVKSIRSGEYTLKQIKEYAQQKELILEKLASESDLRKTVNKDEIRTLLLECIKHSYQNVNFVTPNEERSIIEKIKNLVDGYKI